MGGTGLGLSISREIIALHRGNIQMSSELNHGTSVVFSIPANPIISEDASVSQEEA
jgi:signal transduction histidine kinase